MTDTQRLFWRPRIWSVSGACLCVRVTLGRQESEDDLWDAVGGGGGMGESTGGLPEGKTSQDVCILDEGVQRCPKGPGMSYG